MSKTRILDPTIMAISITRFLDLWPLLLVITVCPWRLHVSEAQSQQTVRLELGNPPQARILSNNSRINITSIGDGRDGGDPLVCATKLIPCCAEYFSRAGNWTYPNGTEVPISGAGYSFYRYRRDSDGSDVLGGALLNRRHGAMGPTGIYSCLIPDRDGKNQTLYVELYISNTTTTEEPTVTITKATTAAQTTTQMAEVTTEAETMATIAQTTTHSATTDRSTTTDAATTEAMTITTTTREPTANTATDEAIDAGTTTQDMATTTEAQPIVSTNQTNTMSPDVMQTTEGPMATDVVRVICDSLPSTPKSDPLFMMAIIEGVIIAILIVILTVIAVAFLHWRQKRKTGLYNMYVAKNPMVEQGGSASQARQRGGTLISGNVAYFSAKMPTAAQKGGTLMATNEAYAMNQQRKPVEMETSIYVDMDKEDRMLRRTFQKIDTPVLQGRRESKGQDEPSAE